MFSSSPILSAPSTPLSNRSGSYRSLHKPINSSPLAQRSSPPFSSPVAEAQARRKSQYKNRAPSINLITSRTNTRPRSPSSSLWSSNSAAPSSAEAQKAFLRDRFKSRCLERAEKAREKARNKRRSEASSDGFDEAMDDAVESDEDVLQDELFRRVMLNHSHREKHEYRRSYYNEVGSSFDPDLEEMADWEQDSDASQSSSTVPQMEMAPEDLEKAELEAYAQECERQAALAEFEDIPIEELFGLDDTELRELIQGNTKVDDDIDMDMH